MELSVRLSFLSLFFAPLFFISRAQAFTEYKKYGEHLWELELAGSSFNTNANYSKAGGSYDSLPFGNTFKLTDIDLGVRHCITPKMALFAESRLGVVESRDPIQTRSNSELNRASLGSDFVLFDGGIKLIPEVMAHFPMVKSQSQATNAQTSEGDLEILGRLIARYDVWKLHNQASLGLNYRDGGRSTLLTFGAGTEYEFGRSFVGADIDGYSTMIQDENTANPQARESGPLSVNAQSAIFNSVNPSLMSANGWYRYDNTKNSFQVGLGTTVTGVNVAQGQIVFANWIYRFQTESSHPTERLRPELERFHEETTDEVDQKLFQAPAPTPIPKIKRDTRKLLQQDLDQTEMQIELKAKKTRPSGN